MRAIVFGDRDTTFFILSFFVTRQACLEAKFWWIAIVRSA